MTITAVWRIRGHDFDVEGFLSERPSLTPSFVWKKGDRRRGRRRKEEDSGANIPLCEHPGIDSVMRVVRKWLILCRNDLRALKRCGASSVLDLGVYVGSPEQFAARVEIQPDDALQLARAGVAVAVSAYPVSGDD